MSADLGRGPRFVEADVTVSADAEDLEIDPAGPDDRVFEIETVPLKVLVSNGAVRDVDVPGGDVDVVKQVGVHEVPVALLVLALETEVLVEVEGRHVGE